MGRDYRGISAGFNSEFLHAQNICLRDLSHHDCVRTACARRRNSALRCGKPARRIDRDCQGLRGAKRRSRDRKIRPVRRPQGQMAEGAKADVFASANMEHPAALRDAHLSGPVFLFTRNRLCALAKPGLVVDSSSLLARLLDPAVALGTSTPKSDPSGDYAWEVLPRPTPSNRVRAPCSKPRHKS